MAEPPAPDPSRRPYDPARWQPEDGDPFKGNAYDRAQDAVDETLRDGLDCRRPKWDGPVGFLVDLVFNLIFRRRR